MFAPRLIILQPTPYCNIDCSYCYLGNRNDRRLMSAEVVEAVREKIIARLPRDAPPAIVWHAGEPTAAPIRWYEHAHERLAAVRARTHQLCHAVERRRDRRALDRFLHPQRHQCQPQHRRPARFHDARRRTRNGKPTWCAGDARPQAAAGSRLRAARDHRAAPRRARCADEYFDVLSRPRHHPGQLQHRRTARAPTALRASPRATTRPR